jgi:predicted RNase H-like HicB family nuclease
MPRYIAIVEYADGQYWISFPGIQKAGSHAKGPEDIVAHSRRFLEGWAQNGGSLPASLDDAITTDAPPPFDGTKLVVFDWEPPAGYRPLAELSEQEFEEEITRRLREPRQET